MIRTLFAAIVPALIVTAAAAALFAPPLRIQDGNAAVIEDALAKAQAHAMPIVVAQGRCYNGRCY